MQPKSLFSKLDHIAIIIDDMDVATRYFESLGFGPFQPVVVSLDRREVRGKIVTDVKNKASLGSIGSAMIELVQPLEGRANIYKEYRDSKGEGIHHVCFSSDDVERDTATLQTKGIKVLSRGFFSGGGGYVYFDTASTGGIILELMQWAPGFSRPTKGKLMASLSRFDHMGVTVRNIAKAIEYYQSLSIGPFEMLDLSGLTGRTIYGKPMDFENKMAITHMDGAGIELIEPVKNGPLFEEFLASKGEGINHLGFKVDNLDQEIESWTKKGIDIVLTARIPGGGGGIYLDVRKVGGIMVELVQW